MGKLDDLAAANNALQQAISKTASTPVDVHDATSVERKQATMKAAGAAAKDALAALAALDQ